MSWKIVKQGDPGNAPVLLLFLVLAIELSHHICATANNIKRCVFP